MAEYNAKLGLIIQAKDEASEAFLAFARNVQEAFSLINKDAATFKEAFASSATIGEEDMSKLTDSIDGVGLAINAINDKLVTTQGEIGKTAESFGTMAKVAALQDVGTRLDNFGSSVTGYLKDAFTQAAGFDQKMSAISATLDSRVDPSMRLTGDQIDAMTQKALTMGQQGFFSANDVADAMYTLARQGIDYQDIMGGAITSVQNLAVATDSNLSDTANVVSDVVHEMGDELSNEFGDDLNQQFTGVANVISGAMHNARMTMDDFLGTLKYVGPQAGALGLSITDTATAISLLAEHGIKGSQAGTTLRRTLTQLVPTTQAGIDKMKEYGLITKDGTNLFIDQNGQLKSLAQIHDILNEKLQGYTAIQQEAAMKSIFGQYAMAGMTIYAGTSADKMSTLRDELTKYSDAQDLANAKWDNAAGSVRQLQAHYDTLVKEIGESLTPAGLAIVDTLQKVMDVFDKLDPKTRDTILAIAGIGGAFAVVSGKVMSLIANIGFLKIALSGFGGGGKEKASSVASEAEQGATTGAESAAGAGLGAKMAGAGATAEEAETVAGGAEALGGAEAAAGGAEAAGLTAGVADVAGGLSTTGAGAIVVGGTAVLAGIWYEMYKNWPAYQKMQNDEWAKEYKTWLNVKQWFSGEDLYGDIQRGSNKTVATIVQMSDQVEVKLLELKATSGTISDETATAVINASNKMKDLSVQAADDRMNKEIADAQILKDDLPQMAQDTYQQVLDKAKQQHDDTVKSAQELNDKVTAEVQKMQSKGITVTDSMKEQILKDFQDQRDGAIEATSDTELQASTIIAKLKGESGSITKEMVSQTIKDANGMRDDAVNAANDRYNKEVGAIVELRDKYHIYTSQQADDLIAQAARQKDGAISDATTMRDKVVAQVKQMGGDSAKDVDEKTGDILEGWTGVWHSIETDFDGWKTKWLPMWGNFWNHLLDPVNDSVKDIKGIWNDFVTNLHLPDSLKLPTGNSVDVTAGAAPKMPMKSLWFADGGILTNPTLFGAGEAGPEALLPLDVLPKLLHIPEIENSLNTRNGKIQVNNINITVSGAGKDGNQIGADIAKQLRLQMPMVTG